MTQTTADELNAIAQGIHNALWFQAGEWRAEISVLAGRLQEMADKLRREDQE